MATIEIVSGIKDHYTMIPNEIARAKDVSPRAIKVYCFLRSHSAGFRVNVRGIATQLGMGKNSVNAAINDLENLGYVRREWLESDNGLREGIRYKVFESRCPQNEDTGVPDMGNPKMGIPKIGTHKEDYSFKKTNPKEEQNLKPEFEAGFDAFWVKYPRKAGKDKAREKYAEALETSTVDELMKSVTVFAEECQHQQTEIRYIPYPGTWLNQKRYLDYLNVAPRKKSGKEKIDAALSWDVTKM